MSMPTQHGINIAEQIQEDTYGNNENLTIADIWPIINQLHTHFMNIDENTAFLEKWMLELEKTDNDLPAL